ncbi:putative transcriptional regulatory protein [Lachnellula occidentalis]|uniref:Putative transcriptional regulatory protein n=1 Tax=Lachnellula occidentalis TaxID=215460 RepID=A0A8H8UH05_9HELO|nr:putative transcriptional regulatory protein [Lachnellula occidentalis]
MNTRPDEAMEQRVHQIACERSNATESSLAADARQQKLIVYSSAPVKSKGVSGSAVAPVSTHVRYRPVSRGYVQALEGQIASLEKFITKLITVDSNERDLLLRNFSSSSNHLHVDSVASAEATEASTSEIPIRSRTGHLRKLKDGKAAEFYGPTSFFQISPSQDPASYVDESLVESELIPGSASLDDFATVGDSSSAFSPQSDICRKLMARFFQHQYQYLMCLYREWFLRDFDAGAGPYYSDLLMYSICALGAIASEEIALRDLSSVFFNRAQELLYGGALESPNLTTLQALILLGHREIGIGKASRGWLFSGMAFRLAHEMGLHLDPSNWTGSDDSRIEREILRRTYWAAFVADKQLSLYFGRPPALYPAESDVRDTERIPYPPEWASLLNTYIMQGTSETAYEDGLALVAGWVHQVELCKILHRMITEVFENRSGKTDETVLSTSAKEIHVALTKWSSDLPSKLHWNQWTVGHVPSLVLHLHMQYHAAMIILHRPPRHMFRDPKVTTSQDVTNCYSSLESLIKLLGIYSRQHSYSHLPFTFVHILATAASAILMKRYIEKSLWSDAEFSRPINLVIGALDSIAKTWPCAKQVRGVISSAISGSTDESAQIESPQSFDLMTSLTGADYSSMNQDLEFEMDDVNIGTFMPDAFFGDGYQWDDSFDLDPASVDLFNFENPMP